MTPPAAALGWLLVALAAWIIAVVRLAALPTHAALPLRLTLAGLAGWMLGILVCLLVGPWPGGFRAVPLTLGMVALSGLVWRLTRTAPALGWWRLLLPRWRAEPGPERLVWLAVALTLGGLWLQVLRLPPTGVDSLGYHLLGPIHWVQIGQLQPAPTYWAWANSYPQNVELLSGAILVFWPHTRVADAPNLLFLVLASAALTAAARALGASVLATGIAVLLMLLSPFVVAYASATYVDIPVAACLMASVALVLAARQTSDVALLGWAWCALSLAAGSKPSGLIGLAIFSALAWVLLRHTTFTWPRAQITLATVLMPFALFTAFWYLRTWGVYGNPLYPWSFELAGVQLFSGPAGPYQAHIESIEPLYVGTRHPWLLGWLRYFGHFGGELRVQLSWAREWFGPQTSIVGTVAVLWALGESWRTRNFDWAWICGAGLLLALLNPAPMVPRFAAHLPLWTALALSLLLTSAPHALRLAAQTGLVASFLLTLLVLPFSLAPLDESTNFPDRFYTYLGSTYWWAEQVVQPGDTIVYVQPLRATGRMIPMDLSARLRYVPPTEFSETVLAPVGTTWMILADEERVTRSMDGQDRAAVLAQLRAQTPGLIWRRVAAGTTFNMHNYQLYALRPRTEGPGEEESR